MKRYNIYYQKYCIIANDYLSYVEVVETEDIYHEIGKKICTSLERIKNIRYTEPTASKEDCEKLWLDNGYRRIGNLDCFVKEKGEIEK